MPKFDNKEIKVIEVGEVVPVYSREAVITILDKIRAEIELKEKTLTDKYGQQKYGIWTDDVLQIIDKYKTDKEQK